ncbi:unnamed protein product, partial [Polarella glacialis]
MASADRKEAQQEIGEGDVQTWPYEADDGDHFETSKEAYEDVAPLLRFAARSQARAGGWAKQGAEARLRIYDPYFCSGRARVLLTDLGFPNVSHRRRDFYKDIADGTVPRFDVLLTNPPYSGDHKERLLQFVLDRQRLAADSAGDPAAGVPFMLLLPSWTVGKAFFRSFLRDLG